MRDHLMMNICHVPVNFLGVIPNSYGNSAQIGMFIFIVQTETEAQSGKADCSRYIASTW